MSEPYRNPFFFRPGRPLINCDLALVTLQRFPECGLLSLGSVRKDAPRHFRLDNVSPSLSLAPGLECFRLSGVVLAANNNLVLVGAALKNRCHTVSPLKNGVAILFMFMRANAAKLQQIPPRDSLKKSRPACLLVPGGGLEPPHCYQRRILNPLRLPIPPSRQRGRTRTRAATEAAHYRRFAQAAARRPL